MKKFLLAAAAAFTMAASVFAVDFEIRLLPSYDFTFEKVFSNVLEGTVSLDVSPLTVFGRDKVYFSAQGSGSILMASSLPSMSAFDGGVAAGYTKRFTDRFSLSAEAFAGIWYCSGLESYDISAASGITLGARVLGNFHISPSLKAGVFAGYKSYVDNFMNAIEVGAGLTYSFTDGLFKKTSITTTDYDVDYLFPVFYSRYNDHNFGYVTFVNDEPNAITDVTVSIFIPQFMSNPDVVAEFPVVQRNEEFTADLHAFLNENILNALQEQNVDAQIKVAYRSLGTKLESEQTIPLKALTRTNMTWEDDRRASAFVSGHDASVQRVARQIASVIKPELDSTVPYNIQYAAAVYATLKDFGLNYVIDASSAFTDNVGTAAIDSLNYPYMTLVYHGGDCDDLSILNCSLFQAVDIKSAFITIPGHIYMAFDSGLTLDEARSKLSGDRYIVYDDIVWIPVEITLTQDTFYEAWATGVQEWNRYGKEAVLIPMYEAWREYNPVAIPDSDKEIQLPAKNKIIADMKANLKTVKNKCLR